MLLKAFLLVFLRSSCPTPASPHPSKPFCSHIQRFPTAFQKHCIELGPTFDSSVFSRCWKKWSPCMPLLVCHSPRLVQPHICLIYGANCDQPHTETLLKQANLSNCWPSSDAAFIEIRPVLLGNCCPGTTLQAPVSELPPHSSYLTIVVALYFLVTQLRSSTAHVPVNCHLAGEIRNSWQ